MRSLVARATYVITRGGDPIGGAAARGSIGAHISRSVLLSARCSMTAARYAWRAADDRNPPREDMTADDV